jgi:hypothetical protein
MDKPFLSFVIELAASGLMLYASAHPDANYAAAIWLIILKGSRYVAQAAGRLAMRAEVRYFETVRL